MQEERLCPPSFRKHITEKHLDSFHISDGQEKTRSEAASVPSVLWTDKSLFQVFVCSFFTERNGQNMLWSKDEDPPKLLPEPNSQAQI